MFFTVNFFKYLFHVFIVLSLFFLNVFVYFLILSHRNNVTRHHVLFFKFKFNFKNFITKFLIFVTKKLLILIIHIFSFLHY